MVAIARMASTSSRDAPGANRCKAYALRHQHAGVRNHAVDHRFDKGAMIADEDDDRALFARNVVQRVSLAVGGRKPELRRRVSRRTWVAVAAITHLLVPKYMLTTTCRGAVSKACSRVA